MIRKEAWSFYRTIFGVRLSWEPEEPKGPAGPNVDQEIEAPVVEEFVTRSFNRIVVWMQGF